MGFIIGLDLGQVSDPAAMAVVERTAPPSVPDGEPTPPGPSPKPTYACRGLKRWHLGTSYTVVAKETAAFMEREGLAGSPLVVDASGCGRPVVDMLKDLKMPARLVPVVITAGLAETKESGVWHVAKTILISTTLVLLQQRQRLEFAEGMPGLAILERELENYRTKITVAANEVFNAREGEHDDLVLALALACWWGEKGRGSDDFPEAVEPDPQPYTGGHFGRGRRGGPPWRR